jgi:hypothetical protein
MKNPLARLGGKVKTNALSNKEVRERRYARQAADFREGLTRLSRWVIFRSILGGMFK